MTVDAVATTRPATNPPTTNPVTVNPTSSGSSETKESAPPPSTASALDTLKGMIKDGDPANVKFLQGLMGARSEEEMMQIINANPLAFLAAVQSWAQANGIKGKSTDELIGMFLGRLRSDMGFDTSSAGVPEERRILLVGGNDRLNATVSAIGQMIYERYGEAAWKEYRAKIEADWGDDGQLSPETLTMLDDALSTEEANYKPQYDASGKLLAPPPEVRIAQLYVELGKEFGSIKPDKPFNDMAAQVHFQTGQDLEAGDPSGTPKPVTTLVKAVQTWLQLEQAYVENQRKLSAGEIKKDEYLKTESMLSVQIKEAKSAVTDAAKAAGVDPKQLLDKETAKGVLLALTDPAAAAQIDELAKLRASRDGLAKQIQAIGDPLAYPHMQQRLATLKNLDAQITQIEADLKKKGIEVPTNPKAAASFGAGIDLVRDKGLDKAYAGEAAEAKKAAAPTYEDLISKIQTLNAKRAELAAVDKEEAAGTLSPGLAEAKRASLKAHIAGLEAELAQLAKANGVPPEAFTDPDKAQGYIAAARTSGLGELFVTWRQLKTELAKLEADVAAELKAGINPADPEHAAKVARIAELKAKLQDTEHKIHDKIYGVDPAAAEAAATLEAKRAERDAAKAKWDDLNLNSKDRDAVAKAYFEYERLDNEVKALEATPRPPVEWKINIDAYADGAIAAEASKANAGWRYQNDAAYKAGYDSVGNLTPEQLAAITRFVKAYDDAHADKILTMEEQEALIVQYKEVAAFLPPQFHGPKDTSALGPTDKAWIQVHSDARDKLVGSFSEGQAQRAAELQAENEQLVMAADAPTLLAKLTELADGKLKGESATAHVQYVLQMLGIRLTPEELVAFAKGDDLPPAKQKAMQLAAQLFAQSQGLAVDDATALKTLRNALNGDMGHQKSDPKVGKWAEYTYAGTDDPNEGPATPQTELLRSMLSVLRSIYAEVYGDEAAAALDKKVEPRFFDGAIVSVDKEVTNRSGTRKEFDHYALASTHWDPETGQVTGFKDKPWAMTEWKFEVVLVKSVTTNGRGGPQTQTTTERVDPNDQQRIAQLKAEGFTIARVEAKPASEPQRMLGRLLEGLFEYMKTYKPIYDENGVLTNPPPIARIAQYYVQTQFSSESSDYPDGDGRTHSYGIDNIDSDMTDAEAIQYMFRDLGMPESDINALMGISGQQLSKSSTLYDPESKDQKIGFTVVDSVFTFGLMSLFKGLIDKTTSDPLTTFAADKLKEEGRDPWRAKNRDKMDDPSVFNLVFDTLMFAVPEAFGGIAFTAGVVAGRLARRGADVADSALDASRGTPTGAPSGTPTGAPSGAPTGTPDAPKGGTQYKSVWDLPLGPNGETLRDPNGLIGAHRPRTANQPLIVMPIGSDVPSGSTPPVSSHPIGDDPTPPSSPIATRSPTPSQPGSPTGSSGAGPSGAPPEPNRFNWQDPSTYQTLPPNSSYLEKSSQPGVRFTSDDNGAITGQYVEMRDASGNQVFVRVFEKDGKWYIYNPKGDVTSPEPWQQVAWNGDTKTWKQVEPAPASGAGPSGTPPKIGNLEAGTFETLPTDSKFRWNATPGMRETYNEKGLTTAHYAEMRDASGKQVFVRVFEKDGKWYIHNPKGDVTSPEPWQQVAWNGDTKTWKQVEPTPASGAGPSGTPPIDEIEEGPLPTPTPSTTGTANPNPLPSGTPTTTSIYRWEPGVTLQTLSESQANAATNAVEGGTDLTGRYLDVTPDGGPTQTYVAMRGPDGKDALVRVVRDDNGNFRIYNPSASSSPANNMQQLAWDGATRTWRMVDATPVFAADYRRYLKDGTFTPGRPAAAPTGTNPSAPAPLPGVATQQTVAAIRTGTAHPTLVASPEIFTVTDPLDLLEDTGRKFLAENPERATDYQNAFNDLRGTNSELLTRLHEARDEEAFWAYAVQRLEELQRENPSMTWAQLRERDPEFANALTTQQRSSDNFNNPDGVTPISTLIRQGHAEMTDATKRVADLKVDLTKNAQSLIDLVRSLDGEGNAKKGLDWRTVARNTFIATVITGAVGGATFLGVQRANQEANPPKKPTTPLIDGKETLPMGPDQTETVDVAELSGTKGKGYLYAINADYVRDKGVSIDMRTGQVTISTDSKSVLRAGETSFSVTIRDAQGNYKGKFTITVVVAEEKDKTTTKPADVKDTTPTKPAQTTVAFNVQDNGPPASINLKELGGIPNGAAFTFAPTSPPTKGFDQTTPPKGLTLDPATGVLTATPGEGSELTSGTIKNVKVQVTGSNGENLGTITVNLVVP